MRIMIRSALAVAVGLVAAVALPAHAVEDPTPPPTPSAACAKGDLPEGMQGRVPAADYTNGRAAKGYRCNATELGHVPGLGGYRVERYVDASGHECAFYDSEASFGANQPEAGPDGTGVYVIDMHDSRKPVRSAVLRTPAMQIPHESLRLNERRGLLAAAASTQATGPALVDVYDVKTDCRQPKLLSSTPLGILGHESGFAPDGKTFYVASLAAHTLAAVDLTDPALPSLAWLSYDYAPHGVSISEDGKTLYMAENGNVPGSAKGLTILDVSQVQSRTPQPVVKLLGRTAWGTISTPQNATPFTRDGRRYVLETDEFGERKTGAARILDVSDVARPKVISDLRLQVNQPEVYDQIQADPGNDVAARGYQAHYCSLPSRVDPNLVACSFIMSGLRVFDIRDPQHPREVAYFNRPLVAPTQAKFIGSFAMSAPAYDPRAKEIWYADGNSGLYAVRVDVGFPFAGQYVSPGN